MGVSRPRTPSPYAPDTAVRMKDVLGDAITSYLDRNRLSHLDIAKRYRSIRASDINEIRQGGARFYGINRLLSICEALGIRAELQVSA